MLRSPDMAVIEFRRAEPERPTGEPAATRGGIRGLFARLGIAVAAADGEDAARPEAPPIATSFENKARTLRANAHAAFHSVEGSGAAALDAALAVIEAEWHAARAERDSYAEALKAIRLYALDPQVRGVAKRALARPAIPVAWDAGLHVSGRDRFPFMDEHDA
jgi:hypothetical protein